MALDTNPMTSTPQRMWGILAAGGSGHRFLQEQPDSSEKIEDKLRVNLQGIPVLLHSLAILGQIPGIEGITIVTAKSRLEVYTTLVQQDLKFLHTAWGKDISISWTLGGDSRRMSVYNGLKTVPPEIPWVAIHDGARPCLPSQSLLEASNCLWTEYDRASNTLGGVMSRPVTDTLKFGEPQVNEKAPPIVAQHLDRSRLWSVQTPQWFNKEALIKAHESLPQDLDITDDAQLMELMFDNPVLLLPGSPRNIKITHPDDVAMAQWFLPPTPLVCG